MPIKIRCFPEHNYKAFHFNGRTIRLALDNSKPITELAYPEFYDVKVTSKCLGMCKWCYQNSLPSSINTDSIVDRFKSFFDKLTPNQKPFQIAFGGGSPTLHPEFPQLIKTCYEMGIDPNYTTNGMWVRTYKDTILNLTTKYNCGVAVSTHPHLEPYWRPAVNALLDAKVHTNLHCIIGNRESIDRFEQVYRDFTGKVKYFVLLPLSAQGRSTEEFSDWEYLTSKIKGSPADVAFGANFHPYLVKDPGRFSVSIYEPESMSAYLDLETMKVYKSSFSSEERKIGNESNIQK